MLQDLWCQLSSSLGNLLLQFCLSFVSARIGVSSSPWLPLPSFQLTATYYDCISNCPWWVDYSLMSTIHYGNDMSNQTQKMRISWRKEENDVFPLSSAVCLSRVALEGTAIETCTSCTHDEWKELRVGCHDKDAGTRCYADTSFLRTCLHSISLPGFCLLGA